MLDKFAPDALIIIDRATDEARTFGHSYIGPEHFLLAFAAQEGSPQSQELKLQGLVGSVLAKQMEIMFGRHPAHNLILRFNAEAKGLLQATLSDFWRPEAEQITAQHIFKVLMGEGSVTVNNILRALNSSADQAVDGAMIQIIAGDKNLMEPPALINPAPAHGTTLADVVLSQTEGGSKKPIDLTANSEIPLSEGDFTEAANFALLFARIEAATFNFSSRQIDSACLLAGLALEQSGAAGKLLRRRGVTIKSIRGAACDAIAQKLIPRDLDCLVFDSQTRRILQAARKESRKYKQSFVSSIHLLWAILSSGQSRAKDILATLVDDMAALKPDLLIQMTLAYEGSLSELDLNDELFGALQAGDHRQAAQLAEAKQPAPTQEYVESFDLSCLNPEGLAVMEAALRQYAALRFKKFNSSHIFLGLLSDGKSLAARYLSARGVTLDLARRKVIEMESLEPVPEEGYELDDNVAVLLTEALALAKQTGARKADPEHLLWALTIADICEIKLLIERLGLDCHVFAREAAELCLTAGPLPSAPFPKFARVTAAGIHIYAMVCEPGVAIAMQIALKEAKEAGAAEVTGGFLLLGLLEAKGIAGEILRSLNVQADTARSALRQFHAPPEPASGIKKPSTTAARSKTSARAKTSAEGKASATTRFPEIDLDPRLEAAFYKALAISLQSKAVAVAPEHLLWGLIEDENLDFIQALNACGKAPPEVLEKLRAFRRHNYSSNPAMPVVDRIVGIIDRPISSSLLSVFEIAAEAANAIGANVLDLSVFIYALSLAQAGPISDKLFGCGLDRAHLKNQIEKMALLNKAPLVNEPYIATTTLAIVARAASLAEDLGGGEVQCEHLMMAILEACRQDPNKQILSQLRLDTESLAIQLCIEGALTTRAQNLQFGPELRKWLDKMNLAAKSVIVNAGVLAAASGRNFIDTEQLLLAIASCGKAGVINFLHEHGLSRPRLELAILRYTSQVMEYSRLPLTFSVRLDAVFKEAQSVATQLNREIISVDHLLLALLKKKSGIASQALEDTGVESAELAARLQLALFAKVEQSERSGPSGPTELFGPNEPSGPSALSTD